MTVPKPKAAVKVAQRRPAEAGAGVAAAIAILISAAVGITDPVVYGALVIVVGAVPAIVTWGVNLRREAK